MAGESGRAQLTKVRFGYTLLQFVLVNLLPVGIIIAAWLFGVFDAVPWLPWVLIAALLLLNFWFGATLTTEHLVAHNIRRRTIPWSDVSHIRAETNLGQRTVVVTDVSGRETRLRAPTTGAFAWDKRFDQKYVAIVDWYQAHR
jgi:hypothetical protein